MYIEFSRKFRKQVEACKEPGIRSKILNIIEATEASVTMQNFPNLKKLTGYKNSFRIRMGDYRIGVVIDGTKVIFAAFDHRSDIYKYFP
jgi:mRNA interferase RelE/StbE